MSICKKQRFRLKKSENMTREMRLKKATGEAARPGHTSKEPGFGTVSGGSVNPPGRHWEHGQSLRRYSKVINAGLVAIAPGKIERIISHRRDVDALDGRRNVSMADFPFSRKLLDAFGAHAVFPQIPGRVRTEMSIVPCDIGLFWANALHKLRHDVLQYNILHNARQSSIKVGVGIGNRGLKAVTASLLSTSIPTAEADNRSATPENVRYIASRSAE